MLQPIHALGLGPRAVITDFQHLRNRGQYRSMTATFLTDIELNQVRPKTVGATQGILQRAVGHFCEPARHQAVKTCLKRLE